MGDVANAAVRMGAGRFADPIERACEEFGIDSPLRQAHFLAQLSVESDKFRRTVESLNYSIEGLLNTFGRHRISMQDCVRLGRKQGRKADQEAIGNLIYGGTWGKRNLGNLFPGDGYKYRGHGLGQHTGRANIGTISEGLFGSLGYLLADPTPLTEPVVSARAAAWWWKHRGVNRLADRNDAVGVTKLWNGGKNGLEERIERLSFARRFLV